MKPPPLTQSPPVRSSVSTGDCWSQTGVSGQLTHLLFGNTA